MSSGRGTQICNSIGRLCGLPMAAFLLVSLLVACKSSTHLAPVDQLDQPPSIKLDYHTVSRNDTLYSIAWRYGMDYHELASINNISAPYTIEVGQKINLVHQSSSVQSTVTTRSAPGVEVRAVAVDANAVTEVVTIPSSSAASVSPSPAKPSSVVDTPVVEPSVKQSVKPVSVNQSSRGAQWVWPANGRLKNRYSSSDPLRKGIDVEGQLGEPVVAAKAGSVVYAGSGLAGYGELVIIKHDERFLSAYGHNSRLLVMEGEEVKTGQKIAEVGSSGADSNQLHFEIRLDGKPVDPLQYLPKK